MRAGRLRHRVTIQENVGSENNFGETVDDWQAVTTRWAAVDPLRGRERFEAQQISAEVSHRVTMRYFADLTPTMRLVYDGRVLEIEAVIDVEERGRELELLCRENADA